MGIFSDEKYRPSESRILATALTFSAGFIDAYTYIQRGHTLSAGQTGNVIFFASAFADHNIAGMLNRATTFIAFTLGLLLERTKLLCSSGNCVWFSGSECII